MKPPYFRLATTYFYDPYLVGALNDTANLMFIHSIAYCTEHSQDGFIPKQLVRHWTSGGTRKADTAAAKLVEEGLWEIVPDKGWKIIEHRYFQAKK
jgi:hypothetical protein